MPAASDTARVHLVTFAQPEPELWGVAIDGMVGVCSDGTWVAVPLQSGAIGDSDRPLAGTAGELQVMPLGDAVGHEPTDSTDQLCRVHGRLALGERQVQIDARGIRLTSPGPEAVRADAVRAVHAHFDGGDALAVTSLRPRKARGHDRDAISAAILAQDSAVVVADPRLSTTYAEDGSVLRVGLELWLDSDEDSVSYPRRAAGQRSDGSVQLGANGLGVEAYAIRWRSRGQDGLGMYAVARAA